MLVLLTLLACTPEPDRPQPQAPATPDPWLDLGPVALEPFRQLLRTPLPEAVAPTRLVSLPEVPLTWVLDGAAGQAWGLDARYQHEPAVQCVDTSLWPELDDDPARKGSCPWQTVAVDRGSMDPGSAVLAIAADPSVPGLWLLGADGALALAGADPLAGNPLDFLRPAQRATLSLGAGPWLLAPDGQGGVWLADGARVQDLEGVSVELGGPVLDLLVQEGTPWLLTATGIATVEAGALVPRASVDGTGGRLARSPSGEVWASLPAEGRLLEPASGAELAVAGLTGPLAFGPDGRAWLAVDEGLAAVDEGLAAADDGAVEAGLEPVRYALDGVVDLVVQDTGELAVLRADGTVSVHVDETRLGGRAPLAMNILTFLENPKPDSEDGSGCTARAEMDQAHALARNNSRVLDDLPATVALGIIAEVAAQSRDCGLDADLAVIWDRQRVAPGLFLYGEQDSDLVDDASVLAYLSGQAQAHADLGIPIAWLGGGERMGDAGVDWVARVDEAGLGGDMLGFALGVLPEVGNWDPRAKDPYPWFASSPPTAVRPASALELDVDDPTGPVRLVPGSSISLFTLGECANTWIFECKQSSLGGDSEIDEDDLQVLSLMLWRALSARSAEGRDHFYFHLPALGLFDYTEGCVRAERWWEPAGDAPCQAALLQGWVFDQHARYVQAGLAEWWMPGQD